MLSGQEMDVAYIHNLEHITYPWSHNSLRRNYVNQSCCFLLRGTSIAIVRIIINIIIGTAITGIATRANSIIKNWLTGLSTIVIGGVFCGETDKYRYGIL